MTEKKAPAPISLTEAAERLDVHYMTAYRWVRTGLLDAEKVGGTWKLDPRDLKAPARRPAGRRPAASGSVQPEELEEVAQRLALRLLAGDEPASWQIIEDTISGGLDAAMVHVGLLAPAMKFVGHRWETGAIGVGDEHRASAVATRLVGRLGPSFRRPGVPRDRVVVGTVEGDRHGLPVALLADVLRAHRFDVVDLGADMPALAYVSLLSSDPDPGAVSTLALCSTLRDNLAIGPMIATIRSARPATTILLGGAGIHDEAHARELGAHVWTGPDGLTAVAAIEAAITRRPEEASS